LGEWRLVRIRLTAPFAELLFGCGEVDFVFGSVWAAQSQATKAQDALEAGEEHLHFLPAATALEGSKSWTKLFRGVSAFRSKGFLMDPVYRDTRGFEAEPDAGLELRLTTKHVVGP
jgi:hypothetical protein